MEHVLRSKQIHKIATPNQLFGMYNKKHNPTYNGKINLTVLNLVLGN